MKLRRTLIIILIIFIPILIFGLKGNQSNSQKPIMPKFRARNSLGILMRSENLFGKYSYLQFVDLTDSHDMDLINNVAKDWTRNNLRILALFEADTREKSAISKLAPYIETLFIDDLGRLKAAFKAQKCCSSFHIYDVKRREIASGQTLLGYKHIKRIISNNLLNNKFSLGALIHGNENIASTPGMRQFAEYRMSHPNMKGYVFLIFTNVCDTCFSGQILSRMSALYDLLSDRIGMLALWEGRISDSDIDNLLKLYKLKFDVYKAGEQFREDLRNIFDEYVDLIVSNTIIFADPEGKIEKIFYDDCKCWGAFDSYVNDYPALVSGTRSAEQRGIKNE